MIIHKLFRRLLLLYANLNYENKRKYLIRRGALIGQGTRMIGHVDDLGSEPYLIEIGENCLLASGVRFITHDGGVKVLNAQKRFGNKRMDIIAPIRIGNNVYIGLGAYIMPGVSIGSNSIIGAGSIVTKSIPENSVAVGIPAKVIETVDEYYLHVLANKDIYETAGMTFKAKRAFFEENKLRMNFFK